jgi:pimeloyl-ACP methyl ester carboxylesterase
VDLRGHGASPRLRGGEGLADLAADVHETVVELLGPDTRTDVLLGHSLGALTAAKLGETHPDLVRRLALEDPPAGSNDPEVTAREVEEAAARARQVPEALTTELAAENPSWAREDVENNVADLRDCDAGGLAVLRRHGLRWNLAALVGATETPTLLMLSAEERGSALAEPERAAVANSLRRGTVEEFDAGHCIHRDDFDRYVRLLGNWLGGPGA